MVSAFAGCESEDATLTVYSGAGLRKPVAELAEEFGRSHGISVECDYAGSETLLSRIKLAKRGDLYLPGDESYIDQAREAGLIASSLPVCYLIPVMIVQSGNPKQLTGPRDLIRPGIQVGLGDSQACAIGRTASQLFAKHGIAEKDLEENVVFRSLTVNELGDKVKLGHLDVAIVWESVAAQFADGVEVVRIPIERNVVSRVPMGVLSCSDNKELAHQFALFAASNAGAEIFRQHGYSVTLPDGDDTP
jgi:molybdate transport system substrate-binding protein